MQKEINEIRGLIAEVKKLSAGPATAVNFEAATEAVAKAMELMATVQNEVDEMQREVVDLNLVIAEGGLDNFSE